MMKKYIIPALLVLMASATAQAQNSDTRSAWAKSQDMYVEPTLTIKETTTVLTPEQAQQLKTGVRQVRAGSGSGRQYYSGCAWHNANGTARHGPCTGFVFTTVRR